MVKGKKLSKFHVLSDETFLDATLDVKITG